MAFFFCRATPNRRQTEAENEGNFTIFYFRKGAGRMKTDPFLQDCLQHLRKNEEQKARALEAAACAFAPGPEASRPASMARPAKTQRKEP